MFREPRLDDMVLVLAVRDTILRFVMEVVLEARSADWLKLVVSSVDKTRRDCVGDCVVLMDRLVLDEACVVVLDLLFVMLPLLRLK